MAWMLLWRAVVAAKALTENKNNNTEFYEGQVKTAEFFIQTMLPVTLGKMTAIESSNNAANEIPDGGFGGL
jgi:hypothetical protein